MSNVLTQFPSGITIKIIEGNDFSFRVDWGFDISAYTFSGAIIPANGLAEVNWDITIVDAVNGLMDVAVASGDLTGISKSANNLWYLDWTFSGIKRTVIGGVFVIYPKNTILKQSVEVA